MIFFIWVFVRREACILLFWDRETSNAGELTDEQFLEKTQELAGSSVVEDVGD